MRPVPVVFLRLAFSLQLTVGVGGGGGGVFWVGETLGSGSRENDRLKAIIMQAIKADLHLRILALGKPHDAHTCFGCVVVGSMMIETCDTGKSSATQNIQYSLTRRPPLDRQGPPSSACGR